MSFEPQSDVNARSTASVNWSEELEQLHEESSRTHFIDVWTRNAMLAHTRGLSFDSSIVDLGCSSGYLLEDTRRLHPDARLFGLDGVFAGLLLARENVAPVALCQGVAHQLPFASAGLDAVLSANLLEHLPDDSRGLAEIHRILRPGGLAVIVVPRGPKLYDYYDRYLQHERRYARGEMAAKGRDVGFEVVADHNLGSLLYPAFWLVKKRNRMRFDRLRGDELEARVAEDIKKTTNSALGTLACRIEAGLLSLQVLLPMGIRGLTVFRRPS